MNILRGINRLVAFLLELVLAVSLGYGGYSVVENVYLKYTLAVLLPLTAIVCWSIFVAPRSTSRLEQPWRLIGRLSLYLACSLLLYNIGRTTVAISLASLATVNEIIAFIFND
ncbi:MAG TPA: YrdB family protein [Ferruginibacter sp.]|jgi:hypothetical protein|nr:YrdB family protein [Ferruginibacter sp.]